MFRILVRYFLRGLLILAPAALTVYLLLSSVRWLNNTFDLGTPGLGIVVMAGLLTVVGWLGSSFGVRPLLVLAERLVGRMPLVGIIYSSLRDLFAAFVGDNQKFSKPVLVQLTEDSEARRIGFVTHDSLTMMALPEMAAVYLPDSYNFSGELLLVPRRHITYLNLPSAQVMKFVVSGGVAAIGAEAGAAAPVAPA